MPLPQYTEEDIKAAERELKGKKTSSPARASAQSGVKPRSLHHIDDDDEPAPAQKPQKAQQKSTEAEPAETSKPRDESANTPIDRAPLKDDSDKPQKND